MLRMTLALGLCLALSVAADCGLCALVVVEPCLRYQTLVGYGQGSMDQRNVPWYTELAAAERERLLDRLYTLRGDGLGLTICRTYMCAGDALGHAHFSRRPGGLPAPLGYEPADGVYAWDGHEASLWHAQGAQRRGAMMVAFWNSPPHWLTVSGCTSGAADGGPNLRQGLEDRFARHVVAVLKHYRDAWGVDYERVSPINEPEADWWQENGGQDGCHVDAAQAVTLINALDRRLRGAGLRCRLQAFEAAYAGSLGYLDRLLFDRQVRSALAELTCHQYIAAPGSLRRWRQRARAHGKPLWMSEWGDWTNQGLELALNYARKLHEAHRVMQAEAWCMWEPGFLLAQTEGRLEPNVAYYAVAQFMRFARPGMRVIEATDTTAKTTAYLDEAGRQLVVITVNDAGTAVPMRCDLSAFEGLREVRAWRTSEHERLAPLAPIPCRKGFATELPAESVTTFVGEYRTLSSPLVANGGFETGGLGPWRGEPEASTGVQHNYPQGGLCDGFIDLIAGQSGRLWQEVTGLEPGAPYVLSAACATSGLAARLGVSGEGLVRSIPVSGGEYQFASVEFRAPGDGRVTVSYEFGPATEWSWATLDNVMLRPGEP